MGLTKLILKFAAPLPRIENYERYLFLGPHPDDIEIGAGATAAKLAALGKQVCFLICTDGRFGDGSAPDGIHGQALIEMRKQEAIRSASAANTLIKKPDLFTTTTVITIPNLAAGFRGILLKSKVDIIFME